MAKLKAKQNLTIGEGKVHRSVKAGHVFEVADDYAAEHLQDHHAEETDEPVTVLKAPVKKAKAEKKGEEPKAEAKLEAKDEKKGK